MSWFAIALDEIITIRILREKADCKQSSGNNACFTGEPTWKQGESCETLVSRAFAIRSCVTLAILNGASPSEPLLESSRNARNNDCEGD